MNGGRHHQRLRPMIAGPGLLQDVLVIGKGLEVLPAAEMGLCLAEFPRRLVGGKCRPCEGKAAEQEQPGEEEGLGIPRLDNPGRHCRASCCCSVSQLLTY